MSTDMTQWRADQRADRTAEREAKRQDRQADRDADRADRRVEREESRKDKAAAEARRRRDRADRAARRTEQLTATRAWFKAEGDTAFTIAMIGLAVVPAVLSQVHALQGKTDIGSALALALMLELGAWSATVGGSRAMRDGRPVAPYRVAMWLCASIAAGINVSHNGGITSWFAWVMGAASLAGVAFWELRCVGRHGTSRRTKEQRTEDRARRRHLRQRRRHHKPIWQSAQRILSGAPYGSLTTDQAWAMAWADVHGDLEPGRTGAMEVQRATNSKALREALHPRPQVVYPAPGEPLKLVPLPELSVYRTDAETAPEDAASPQVDLQIPPADKAAQRAARKRGITASVKGGKVGPGNPPRRRPGDTPRYSQAARVAASITARQSAA